MCNKGYLNLRRLVDLQILKIIFIIMISALFFSGCISVNDKNQITKPLINNTKPTKKQYNCKKNIKLINYTFAYVSNEFEKGYFEQKDILGAKAQLFLIENKSKSIFAQNINAAQKEYYIQYIQLQKKKCSVSKYTVSPLQKIKNRIKKLDTNNETSINK